MASFSGVKRRFQLTGTWNGVAIYDDYGHHPVEIAAVLKAARAGARGRVIAVVEPHRYTRVRDLFDEFAACFKDADARHRHAALLGGRGADRRRRPRVAGRGDPRRPGTAALPTVDSEREIAPMLRRLAASGDMVICLGAGQQHRLGARAAASGSPPSRCAWEARCELRRSGAGARGRTCPICAAGSIANQPLADITWFRVGGPAQVLFTPADAADLAYFLRSIPAELPVFVIGLGSNLLVRDGGVPGVVIRLGRGFAEIEVEPGHRLRAGTAVPDVKLARAAADAGIAGLAFYRGIPGSIGGALRMNAGAHGRETKDVLVEARAVDRQGNMHVLSLADMELHLPPLRRAGRLDLHRGAVPGHARRSGGDPQSRWTRSPSTARPTSRSRSAPAAPPSRTRRAPAPGS